MKRNTQSESVRNKLVTACWSDLSTVCFIKKSRFAGCRQKATELQVWSKTTVEIFADLWLWWRLRSKEWWRLLSYSDVVTRSGCASHVPKVSFALFLHFVVTAMKDVLPEQAVAIRNLTNSATYTLQILLINRGVCQTAMEQTVLGCEDWWCTESRLYVRRFHELCKACHGIYVPVISPVMVLMRKMPMRVDICCLPQSTVSRMWEAREFPKPDWSTCALVLMWEHLAGGVLIAH